MVSSVPSDMIATLAYRHHTATRILPPWELCLWANANWARFQEHRSMDKLHSAKWSDHSWRCNDPLAIHNQWFARKCHAAALASLELANFR
jgi:hypothetical protein